MKEEKSKGSRKWQKEKKRARKSGKKSTQRGRQTRGRSECQRGPAQFQLDIQSVFSVSESSKNHQSLRFGDSKVGSISNHFPTAFQGLPNVYLFWINVINPPVPGVAHKKRVTVKRLQGLCFSYSQRRQHSAQWLRDFISVEYILPRLDV